MILPTRESVCTSGIPTTLYQSSCSMYNQNLTASGNWTTDSGNMTSAVYSPRQGSCTTIARDLAEADVSLGCM